MRHVKLGGMLSPMEKMANVAASAAQSAREATTRQSGTISVPNADGTRSILGVQNGNGRSMATHVGDTTPPGKPLGVSATSSSGVLVAHWSGELEGGIPDDFAKLVIKAQADGEDEQVIGELYAEGSVSSSRLSVGKTYLVWATAEDDACSEDGTERHNVSVRSDSVSVTVTDVAQHFWSDSEGAHVTHATQEEWQASHAGQNSLWSAEGMLFRDALTNRLAIYSGEDTGIAIFDGAGNDSGNIMAMFGADGARIGRDGSSNVSITRSEMVFHGAEGAMAGRIAMSDESVLIKTASYSLDTVGASWVHDTVTGLSPIPEIGVGQGGAIVLLNVLFDGSVVGRYGISSLSDPPISITVETTDATFQTSQDGDTWGIIISARNREEPERVVNVTFDIAWAYIGTAPTYAFGTSESEAPYAFSAGEGLDAQGPGQAVFGRYNEPSRTDLLIVGNGTADQRSNAFSVDSQGAVATNGYIQQGGPVGLGPEAQQGWWEAVGVKSLIVFREASSAPTAIATGSLAYIEIQCPAVDGYKCVGAMQMWHSTSSGSGNVILGFPHRSSSDNKLHVTARANSASTITVKAYLMYLRD